MQTGDDKRRLSQLLDEGPISALAIVMRCIAGFAILLFVIAGPWSVLETGREADVIGNRHTVLQIANIVPRSVESTKRVFDERRHRYETIRVEARRVRPLAEAER